MKFIPFLAILLACSVRAGFAQQGDPILISGYFVGTEPFWNMKISDNHVIMHNINDIVQDTLFLSKKQAHTATYAFQGKHIFGVVRESGTEGCLLDITEDEDATHEIYFSYKHVTYMGCGKLTVKRE